MDSPSRESLYQAGFHTFKTVSAQALLLASASLLPAVAGTQILLRNLGSADGSPTLVAAGKAGQVYVVSTISSSNSTLQTARVIEFDPNGARLAALDLPQLAAPAAATTDAQGNLIVVGKNQAYAGIVLKVDPQIQSAATLVSLPASVLAVTADNSGNIYLTGSTGSTSFPVTANAYQTMTPASDGYGYALYDFLTEISPTGQLVYSTYFGSDSTVCYGGSYCMGKFGWTVGTAIAIDQSGAVVIAGNTTSTGLPTTPGVLAPTCVCGWNYADGDMESGFVARFHPAAAQQLQWSTYLNVDYIFGRHLGVNAMALDLAGNVVLGGHAPGGLPTGIFQIPGASSDYGGSAFLLKLNSSATAPVWTTYFGTEYSSVQSIFVDAQDGLVFSGELGDPVYPDSPYHATFVAHVTGDGSTLTDYYQGPNTYAPVNTISWAGPTLTETSLGGFASVLPNGALWIETEASGPSLLNIANSASGAYASSVAGAELVSLYGIGIGPDLPLPGEVQNGVFTTSLGGCQVLFNGVAAPLLYADSGQINAVVPRLGTASTVDVQLVTPSGTVGGLTLTASSTPQVGIFTNGQTGLAAALNQDGSVNSPSNAAKSESIVSVFATADSGNGFADGAVTGNGIFNATIPVSVTDEYGQPLQVTFAGAAPDLVNGVMQINFRLPDPLPPGNSFTFLVQIGSGANSASSELAVAP